MDHLNTALPNVECTDRWQLSPKIAMTNLDLHRKRIKASWKGSETFRWHELTLNTDLLCNMVYENTFFVVSRFGILFIIRPVIPDPEHPNAYCNPASRHMYEKVFKLLQTHHRNFIHCGILAHLNKSLALKPKKYRLDPTYNVFINCKTLRSCV